MSLVLTKLRTFCFHRIFQFYTVWALVAHVLFKLGFFYNTFLLAVFVALGAVVTNVGINEQYDALADVVFHIGPFVLLWNEPWVLDDRPIALLGVVYLAYMRLDLKRICEVYRRPVDAMQCNGVRRREGFRGQSADAPKVPAS